MNHVKSPLNYSGNKYKLLEQILPLFPQNVNTFYDLFGGSGTVFINAEARFYVYNELNTKIKELVEWISTCESEQEVINIRNEIEKHGLFKNSKQEYYCFRDKYNETPNNIWLFILSCFSLNYNFRFNSKGNFNMTCGNRDFSKDMEKRFIEFNNKAKKLNVKYTNKNYNNFKNFSENDFVYLDPPYLPTIATYTENGLWTPKKEQEMYDYLDWLNSIGVKFALSNVSIYRDKTNDMLQDWMKKYNIHNLDFKYTNNNRYKKDNSTFTQEVLITNY